MGVVIVVINKAITREALPLFRTKEDCRSQRSFGSLSDVLSGEK